MIRSLFFLALFLWPFLAMSQHSTLEAYVQEALQSNIALRRQELSYSKSLEALKEAKAMYLPQLGVSARFSVAQGGRTIDIPIGDLVNPVYQNLDLINQVNSQAIPDYPAIGPYPRVENESTPFLRPTEQETFVRLSMPVFNAAILHNHKIKDQLSQAERVGVETYKRELVKEVKSAYFNYLKAEEGVNLYEVTLELVEENLRSSESLYQYEQITRDAVYSVRAQQASVEAQLAEARKNREVARAWFNFLLNRDQSTEVLAMRVDDAAMPAIASLEDARIRARAQREEFEQLQFYMAASEQDIKRHRSTYLPQVNLALDYGIQGTNYDISDPNADYFQGSAVLSWTLFDPSNKARTQQARIERELLDQRQAELKQQVDLQVLTAWYEYRAASDQLKNAEAEVAAAEEAFRLIRSKYGQGQANQVEYTEARTRLTMAGQSLIISRYDHQIRAAELERAVGSYPLN